MGIREVIRLGEGNPAEATIERAGEEAVDVVLESVGGAQAIDLAIKVARRGGAISLVGSYVMPPRTPLSEVIGEIAPHRLQLLRSTGAVISRWRSIFRVRQ